MANTVHRIPFWLKILYTLYAGCAIWLYQSTYGFTNFLWFSDVALILTVPALWMENSLLASMMTVSILLPEMGWMFAFFDHIFSGAHLGVTAYMFQRQIPIDIRAISLFHLFLPPLLVWIVYRLGYDRRAWWMQTLLCWVIFVLAFFFSSPADDIDWVFGPAKSIQTVLPQWLYLLIIMLLLPLCVYIPTHWILGTLFRQPQDLCK